MNAILLILGLMNVGAAENHVVLKGDTLWDICKQTLGSGFLWPQIWAFNPEVHNPHWIYPGDSIRFSASDKPLLAVAENLEVVEPVPKPLVPPQRFFVRYYIVPTDLQSSGTLTQATGEEMLLSAGETVRLKMSVQTKPGERYLTYRKLRDIKHPITRKYYGTIIEITGVVLIENQENNIAQAQLQKLFAEVERGQKLLPYVNPAVEVSPLAANKATQGVVLAIEANRVAVGDNQLVFVDKGRDEGLQPGLRLLVSKRQQEKKALGIGDVATLVVVDVKDTSSTCMVVNATREVEPGDDFRTEFLPTK